MNPLGGDFPLITKDGHNVLDVTFTSPILNLGNVPTSYCANLFPSFILES